MKWPQDQIETISALGYTETEARFLYLVATHSGYFTLRHFLTFSGATWGKRSSSFAQKVLRHGHASIRDYMGTGSGEVAPIVISVGQAGLDAVIGQQCGQPIPATPPVGAHNDAVAVGAKRP